MSRQTGIVGVSVRRDGVGLPGRGLVSTASATAGVSVTPGVLNVAGAWTELISSTATTSSWLFVTVTNLFTSATAQPVLLDIAVGAAAAEVAIISSLGAGQAAGQSGFNWMIPIAIQAGSRVSCRLTTSLAALTAGLVRCSVSGRDMRSIGKVGSRLVSVGANVAASTGVAVTTNDTWTEITSGTAEAAMGIIGSFTGNDGNMSTTTELFSIAMGAAGSEVTIDSNAVAAGATEFFTSIKPFLVSEASIPLGTRLAAKLLTGATNGIGVILQLVPYA